MFRSGGGAGSRLVVVHHDRSAESHAARVGFVVSSAVGNAVVRNRVKRRLRAIAAELLAELPAETMLVLRARPAAANADFTELDHTVRRTVEVALQKAARRSRTRPESAAGSAPVEAGSR